MAFERLIIDRQFLREELAESKVLTAIAQRKSSKRIVLEGVRVANHGKMYRKIKALEDAAAEKKKRKSPGRGRCSPRKVQEESKSESEDGSRSRTRRVRP